MVVPFTWISTGTYYITPDRSFIGQNFDVVNAPIPMLLGLDALDCTGNYTDNVDNILVSKKLGYSMPIVRKFWHMYFKWTITTILFTKPELKKHHSQFKHPSVDKLMNLLKFKDVDENTRQLIEEISEQCEIRCMGSIRYV